MGVIVEKMGAHDIYIFPMTNIDRTCNDTGGMTGLNLSLSLSLSNQCHFCIGNHKVTQKY